MPYSEDTLRRARELVRRRQGQTKTATTPSRFGTSTGGGTQVAAPENKGSRFGVIGDAFGAVASIVPDPLEHAAGVVLRDITSGEEALNVPGFQAGTAIRHFLETAPPELPVVGNLPGRALGAAFDVGAAPLTVATVGLGGPGALAGLRGAGRGGKLAAALLGPVVESPSLPTRAFSEVVAGTGGILASEEAAERGLPAPFVLAAGAVGAGVGLYAGNALRGAATRNTAVLAAKTWDTQDDRLFIKDLPDMARQFDNAKPKLSEFEETGVGQAILRAGVDPSKTVEGDLGTARIALTRQLVSADENTRAALLSVFGPYNKGARLGIGAGGAVFDIDPDSLIIKNVRPKSGNKAALWGDFFEDDNALSKYFLTTEQQAAWHDIRQFANEITDFLVTNSTDKRVNMFDVTKTVINRIVKGVDDVEIERGYHPFVARVMEDIAEGQARGIKYEGDPYTVLATMARSAYRKVAHEQFEDLIAPLTLRPGTAAGKLRPDLVQDVANASKRVREAKKVAGATELDAAKKNLKRAQNAWKRHLTATQNSEALPEYLFGRSNSTTKIPVGKWKNKFLVNDADYQKLAAEVNVITGAPKAAQLDVFSRNVRNTADVIRFWSATFDMAAPFIQGLPLLGTDPVRWGKTVWRSWRAMSDPSYYGRYVRENLTDIQEMARYGVPIGDVEQFIALEHVGKLKAVTRTRPGREVIGRFETSYAMTGTASRLELWRALKPAWDGTPEELARTVTNMTGGLNAASLGVGATQRAYESVWLGFSPRLMRSTLALVGTAANPTTPVGRQAARSLLGLAAGATLFFVGTNIAVGFAQGKTWEEVEEDIQDSLNPLGGRKFLSLDIGGQYVGIGGQIRAITQFAAKAIANPSGFVTADQFENPLINYYMGRGAVGVNIAGGLVEGATGERINVLPFENIDSIPDAIIHMGTSVLPFAVQSQLEAEGVSTLDRATMFGLGFGGLNVNEETAFQKIDELARQQYNKPWSELTGVEQQRLEDEHADLFELRNQQSLRFKGREGRQQQAQLDVIDERRLNGERALVDAFQRNQITANEFRDEMKYLQRYSANAKRDIRGEIDYETTDANKLALTGWYELYDKAKVGDTDVVNWDDYDIMEADYLANLTAEQRRFVDERTEAEHAPEAVWFYENEKLIRDSGYWDATDRAFARFANRMPGAISTYSQLVLAIQEATLSGDRVTATRLKRLQSQVNRIADREKALLRRRNPELELALFQNGRITTVNARTAALARSGT